MIMPAKKTKKTENKKPAKKKETEQEKPADEKKIDKKDQSLKNDKMLLISVLVIIACLIALLFAPKLIGPKESEIETASYNGFLFEKHGNIWVTEIMVTDSFRGEERPYEIYFHYTPDQVEDIRTITNSRNQTSAPDILNEGSKIYITTDPDYPASVVLGGVEISKILGNIFQREVKSALTRKDNSTDAPVVTCEAIGPGVRVIELRLGNETHIKSESGCIIVQGESPVEVVRASERLAFELLGIIT